MRLSIHVARFIAQNAQDGRAKTSQLTAKRLLDIPSPTASARIMVCECMRRSSSEGKIHKAINPARAHTCPCPTHTCPTRACRTPFTTHQDQRRLAPRTPRPPRLRPRPRPACAHAQRRRGGGGSGCLRGETWDRIACYIQASEAVQEGWRGRRFY